jgi:hypothetical protein
MTLPCASFYRNEQSEGSLEGMRPRLHAFGSIRMSCAPTTKSFIKQIRNRKLNGYEWTKRYFKRLRRKLQRECRRNAKDKYRCSFEVLRKRTPRDPDAHSIARSGVHFVPRRHCRHIWRGFELCWPSGDRARCSFYLPRNHLPHFTSSRSNGCPRIVLRRRNRRRSKVTRNPCTTMGWVKNVRQTQFAVHNHEIVRPRTPNSYSRRRCFGCNMGVRILQSLPVEPSLVGRAGLYLLCPGALSQNSSLQDEHSFENEISPSRRRFVSQTTSRGQCFHQNRRGKAVKRQKGFDVSDTWSCHSGPQVTICTLQLGTSANAAPSTLHFRSGLRVQESKSKIKEQTGGQTAAFQKRRGRSKFLVGGGEGVWTKKTRTPGVRAAGCYRILTHSVSWQRFHKSMAENLPSAPRTCTPLRTWKSRLLQPLYGPALLANSASALPCLRGPSVKYSLTRCTFAGRCRTPHELLQQSHVRTRQVEVFALPTAAAAKPSLAKTEARPKTLSDCACWKSSCDVRPVKVKRCEI